MVSPQASFHMLAVRTTGDRPAPGPLPDELRTRREMSIVLGQQQRPEPDISVIRGLREHGPEQTAYQAEDVLLAVEDRLPRVRKPRPCRKPTLSRRRGRALLARREPVGRPTVYVSGLDPRRPLLRAHRHPPRPAQAHDTIRHRRRPNGESKLQPDGPPTSLPPIEAGTKSRHPSSRSSQRLRRASSRRATASRAAPGGILDHHEPLGVLGILLGLKILLDHSGSADAKTPRPRSPRPPRRRHDRRHQQVPRRPPPGEGAPGCSPTRVAE